MSFTANVKSELCSRPMQGDCCRLAELSALLHIGGLVVLEGGGRVGVALRTESAAVARRAFVLMKHLFGIAPGVQASSGRKKGSHAFRLTVAASQNGEAVLRGLSLLREGAFAFQKGVPAALVRRTCCRASYLRGAFLGGGTVAPPQARGHLELITSSEPYARSLAAVVRKSGFVPGLGRRGEASLVYLKEGEQIAGVLSYIGAYDAALQLQSARVLKEVRNHVNRQLNCDTANLQKTADAAGQQLAALRAMDEADALASLPAPLRQLARARLDNPDASLAELGEMLTPPLGKSGVYHRMAKLMACTRAPAGTDRPPSASAPPVPKLT